MADNQLNLPPDPISPHDAIVPSIWVDADACPVVVRDMLFRAAHRTGVQLTLVANHHLKTPAGSNIRCIQVKPGFDVADNEIVRRCHPRDLVITSDIPLADEVISKQALVLSPRGEVFNKDNIKARLTMRNFMETMRSSGVRTQGPATLDNTDKMRFANQLDKWLQQHV